MTLVVDASLVVAHLVERSETGAWAERLLLSDALAAPHLLSAEVANYLRRAANAGLLDDTTASQAFADFLAMRIELFPFQSFAHRVWQLRHNVTPYDAWYVALAEALDAPLATLDRRLSVAAGPQCQFVTPAG